MGSRGKRGPELTLLCPACLSRSLSACLSFLGLSSGGETWQLCTQGLSELSLGLTLGTLSPCLTLARGSAGAEPKHLQVRIMQLRTQRKALGGDISRVFQREGLGHWGFPR